MGKMLSKIERMPTDNDHPLGNDCEHVCKDCPLMYASLDSGNCLCDELSKEQLNWIVENIEWLKEWFNL